MQSRVNCTAETIPVLKVRQDLFAVRALKIAPTLFLASFAEMKGIAGTSGTVDEKGKPFGKAEDCGIIAVR